MANWVRCVQGGWGLIEGDWVLLHDAAPWDGGRETGARIAAAEATLLAPVTPRNFLGLWNNFHAAAAKQGQAIPTFPLYFLKSSGSIIGTDAEIAPPSGYTGRVLYEGELGIVIGQTCKDADLTQAAAAIFGYTCVNDVTALDLLTEDASFAQWARAKGCDSFGPVGPVVATGLDWRNLAIRTLLNGRERQNYPASDMILSPDVVVSLISREMTLHPGDLIACGTSLGALPMKPGMSVAVSIEGIGVLQNRMSAA